MNLCRFEIVSVDNKMKTSDATSEISQNNLQIIYPGNFNNVCRTCMNTNNEVLVPILYSYIQNSLKLVDLLNECASVQVTASDELPLNICKNCCDEIVRIYMFRKRCFDVEQTLKELLTTSQQLEESDDNFSNTEPFTDDSNESGSLKPAKTKEKQPNKRKAIFSKKNVQVCRKRREYTCFSCKKGFNSKENLIAHKKEVKHPEVRNHECEICHKKFSSYKLRQHMRSHTKEKPYECKICKLKFSLTGNLKRHIMIHTGERPHVCQFCGKGFIQSSSLRAHVKIHTEKPETLEEPQKFVCKYCGRTFKRHNPFIIHMKKHALQDNTDIVDQEGLDVLETSSKTPEIHSYSCEICSRQYKTKHLLKSHLRIHGEKTFLCSDCGKSFRTKAALHSHFKIHTGEKPHTCTVCLKSFAHISSFDSHMLIHTGLKPHHCHVCPKTFTQLSHLKYHLRTHSGERPYSCSYCGKTFALKGNLTVHVRTHTGETPYLCTICGKGFYDSSSLKKHKKSHDDGRIVESENNFISSDEVMHSSEEIIVSNEEVIKLESTSNNITEIYENVENVIEITDVTSDITML